MIIAIRALVLFIVLTSLVHIFSIVATPFFADQKVWQRVVQHTQARKITALKDHAETVTILGQSDPSMAYAICHFNLKNGPVTIIADGPTSFWNATLFNNDAEIIYSLHDDVSQTSQLNLSITQIGAEFEATSDDPEGQSASEKESEGLPKPNIPPRTDEEDVVDLEVNEEDGNIIQARIAADQVFVVLKIYKASRHHTKLINETFEAAQCT